MKSNGSPDRYAVYIPEHYTRVVEVVANSPEEAQRKAHANYFAGLYERNTTTKTGYEPYYKWHVSRIEGCC